MFFKTILTNWTVYSNFDQISLKRETVLKKITF